MTTTAQQVLAKELMQNDFSFFNDLKKAIAKLRKTAMTPADVKKAGIPAIISKHTGMNIDFSIDPSMGINAYMMTPMIDRNHPFFSSRGFHFPIETHDRKFLGKKGKIEVVDVWTDDSTYKVGGGWSKVVVKVKMLKGLMKTSMFTDGGVTAILLHELGHVYTYFSLFGKLTAKNFLTSEAIKEALSDEPLEKRVQKLEQLEGDLDIHILEKEKVLQTDKKLRGDVIESIVIAETCIKGGSTSIFTGFDNRNIEQIADQFAIFHGAGGDLGEAMNTLYKECGTVETLSTTAFVVIELCKVFLVMTILWGAPLLGIIMLILGIPGQKIYDDPQARVELIRKQLVGGLKEAQNNPALKAQLLDQIDTLEKLEGQLKDRRTFYEVVYQTITPRGRTMYRQEVFMKSVENLLYNDIYLSAAKFGELK